MYVCKICWTNVQTFHNFYKRVEWLHEKHSVAIKTNSSSSVVQQKHSGSVSPEPDLNIVKCEETELRFVVTDLQIKNEECSDNDNVDFSQYQSKDQSNFSVDD